MSLGQRIRSGDRVGLVGSTGESTGAHLHFEIRVDEIVTDPVKFLGDIV